MLILSINSVLATQQLKVYDFEKGISDDFTYNTQNPKNWTTINDNNSMRLTNEIINNNQKTIIYLNNISVSNGTFQFNYKVSSEQNYDFFNFYINGTRYLHVSGIQNSYTTYEKNLSNGVYNFTFEYIKDGNSKGGDDRVYIDNLQYYINVTDDNSNDDNNSISKEHKNIINYTKPLNNENISKFDKITFLLNENANCNLYIDNDLVKSYKNIVSGSYDLETLNLGTHKYLLDCNVYKNNTKYVDNSNEITFTIKEFKNTIDFYIYGKNKELLDYDDLYLMTPCADDKEFKKYWVNEDKKYYIQHLIKGHTVFDLAYTNEYNFCLLKGKINYKYDNFSKNYDFVDVEKQTNLGKLFVKNDTLVYSLIVENDDLYKPTNPKFWDKSWSSLFNLVVSLLIGGFILLIGLITGYDKLFIVGGLIIALGFGLSIHSINNLS